MKIDCAEIIDWPSFHRVFAAALGFPKFYGANMDAWIDCLTYADDAESGMVASPIQPGEILTLELGRVSEFIERCPEQHAALVECAAFVNQRRIEQGGTAVIALSFTKD